MLIIVVALRDKASSAACSEIIDSSRQIGVFTSLDRSACPKMSCSSNGCSISNKLNSSNFARCFPSDLEYAWLASTWSGISGYKFLMYLTASKSQPGSIFSFIRRYPASTYDLTSSHNASKLFAIPTDTPHSTLLFVAPR